MIYSVKTVTFSKVTNMTTLRKLFAAAALILSFNVMADALDDAKMQGLVGEKPDGYLGVVVDSPATRSLVADINTKRKARYQALANKNGITLQQVEALAGEKAISKTSTGHMIWKNGRWVKK